MAAGLSELEARRIFEHPGLPLLDCHGEAWVAERSDVELVRVWASGHVNRRAAAKEIGITSATLAVLQSGGLMKAAIPGERSRASFYSRVELLALVDKATQGASVVSAVPEGSRLLGDFRRSQVSVSFLVAGLVRGGLDCTGVVAGMAGLSGICIREVNQSELRFEQAGGTAAVEVRSTVVKAIEQGMTLRQAASKFGVPPASAGRWARSAGVTRLRIEEFREDIAAAVRADVDMTMRGLANMLWEKHGVKFSGTTVWRHLRRAGLGT